MSSEFPNHTNPELFDTVMHGIVRILPHILDMLPAQGYSWPLSLHMTAIMLLQAQHPDKSVAECNQFLSDFGGILGQADAKHPMPNPFTSSPEGVILKEITHD